MCRCLPIILFIDEGEKESEKLKGEEEEEYEEEISRNSSSMDVLRLLS